MPDCVWVRPSPRVRGEQAPVLWRPPVLWRRGGFRACPAHQPLIAPILKHTPGLRAFLWYNPVYMAGLKAERTVLILILLSFAILASAYSVCVPIFEASDELWHYPMVEVIARSGTLPIQPVEEGASSGPWRQEGSQPPLYYAIGAALTFWIDTSDMDRVRHLNPHVAAGEATPDRNNPNLVVHNPTLERFPWRGTVLAVHIVRLASVLMGTWAVYLTWALVRELRPDPPWLALAAAAVHAFTPMALFISASVNNDALIVPLCSLALLLMVRRAKVAGAAAAPPASRAYLAMGMVLGLGVLTKASALALLPLLAATIAWEAWQWRQGQTWATTLLGALRNLVLSLLPVAVLSGWWFARNLRLYGDLMGFRAFYAVLGTRAVPADLAQLWAERFAFAAGYWGNFGGLNVPLPQLLYHLLNSIAIVAILGLALAFSRWALGMGTPARPSLRPLWPFGWDALTAARALAWVWPVGVIVSWSRWATITWSSQGRLIFSALPMLSFGLVLGWTVLFPPRAQRWRATPSAVIVGLLLALSLLALPVWILPAYRPPSTIAAGMRDEPAQVRFGDTLRLENFSAESDSVQPGGLVTLKLTWTALAPTMTDHSIFIHILGQGERIVAQRDTFPGRGLVSTTWLTPGATWTETYRLRIPRVAYAPDNLAFELGLTETATGGRADLWSSAGSQIGKTVRFGALELAPIAEGMPNPNDIRFGEGIVLEGYDLNALTAVPGQILHVDLYWRCRAPIDADYTVSVQLIDERWNKAAQSDAWPLDGAAPTSTWTVGQQLHEQRTLTIAADAVPNSYSLRIALYRADASGELTHLPVTWQPGQMPAESIVLTQVRVQ